MREYHENRRRPPLVLFGMQFAPEPLQLGNGSASFGFFCGDQLIFPRQTHAARSRRSAKVWFSSCKPPDLHPPSTSSPSAPDVRVASGLADPGNCGKCRKACQGWDPFPFTHSPSSDDSTIPRIPRAPVRWYYVFCHQLQASSPSPGFGVCTPTSYLVS